MKSRIILCGLTLAVAGVARAGYTPVAIQSSSYNADIVVESNATPQLLEVTSATVDQGTNSNGNNTWFEQGWDLNNPQNGLPTAGSTFTAMSNPNYSFAMAPSYKAPNGILIDTLVQTGTFSLISPAAYTKLSFLGSGGNGGDVIGVTVNHADGTSETGFTFGCPDWFNGTLNIALIVGGRCTSAENLTVEKSGNGGDGLGNPRIYFRDITLANTTSPVTNIVLKYSSGGSGSHNDIMAVSGALTSGSGAVTPIAVTGYDYDFVVEASAAHPGPIMAAGGAVPATTETLDNTSDTGNTWYEQGYNVNNSGPYNNPFVNLTGTGIPHPNSLLTNATGDHIYQMPPDYTTNNAVYISSDDAFTNATITLTTPAAYTGLSFLGSAGNGPVPVNYVITHQDSTTEKGVLVINDWFNGSAPAALVANGRVAVDTAYFGNVLSGDPILLENDIVLQNATSPVVSIYLENTNGVSEGFTSGRFGILAVSGAVGTLPPAFTVAPASTNNYVGTSVAFNGSAAANPGASITYQWQKGTNGVFVNLANGGNISGVTSTTLSINPIGFADAASYRLVATDSAASVPSGAATLGVFTSLLDVTQPGDLITVGSNVSPFGDGSPNYAIDNTMNTKFGANYNSGTVPYMVITPSAGRTIVSALRIYTGADSTGRDPASYKLEGSLNGGATYTLISSNSITLSDNRNPLVAVEPNPLTQWVTEVEFANTAAYTTYKLSFPTQKGSGQIQFQELELPGVIDTSKPSFSTQPSDAAAYVSPVVNYNGTVGASFTAVAVFNPTPSLSWFKGTNGVYIPLSDVGNISGSQSTTLSINPTTFADSADYVAVANSTAGYVTSAVAHLYIYSTNLDVTQPGDLTATFGDSTTNATSPYGRLAGGNPNNAIDDTFSEWQNQGSGINALAGFGPFAGPVGFTVTPAVGSTVLAGIRIYPGADSAGMDPSSYILDGSNDGITWSTIASGPLALPGNRNAISGVVDPTYFDGTQYASVQEILFSNTRGFTNYRLTFPNIVDPNNNNLELGDVELLGVPGVGVFQPVIGKAVFSAGNLSITGSGGTPSASYTVQTNANLSATSGWNTASTGTFDSSGNFSVSLPISSATPKLFYRIQQ